MNFKNLAKRYSMLVCSIVGVLAAFGIVLAWFPHSSDMWNYPMHQIDAPAHYYFIRKLLDEGIAAATRLWPNDAYYPPLFHLMAVSLIKLGELFGITVNVYTALNIVWLVTSGIVWPAGMQLFASYFTRRVDGNVAAWRPFSCAMAVIVPVLAVSSACHPYRMLAAGPLIAYGLATSLLPFWLYVTLRFFDAISERHNIIRWLVITAAVGGLCLFAHPRIAFTWLLLMAPFVLLRLPWKLILGMFVAVVLCAVAFFFFMTATYKSDRYLDPSSWFHTYVPNRTVPDALRVFFTTFIDGPAGVFMAVVVAVSIVIGVAVAIRPTMFAGNAAAANASHSARMLRKDAISLLLACFLVGLVYVCSTSLTGWFPNIVAAAWYRSEPRPLTMIPFGTLPLIIFAASAVAMMRTGRVSYGVAAAVRRGITVVLLAALAVSCQIVNPTRDELSAGILNNVVLNDAQPDEQLTSAKYDILSDVAQQVGPDAVVISDPLNGSMYGMTLFGTNMLYPIYNPMAEKNGAIFGEVERAFDSGDAQTLLTTVCPIGEDTPEYFLSMGPQAPSLQMFTFKEQYDPFHKTDLIDQYVADGTLTKVQDYSSVGDYASGWALYRFGCTN